MDWDAYRLKKGMSEHDRAKAMYELYEQGVPIPQIAQAFGVTRQMVYLKFRSFDLPLRPKKRILRNEN